jgi:hypothetical protein
VVWCFNADNRKLPSGERAIIDVTPQHDESEDGEDGSLRALTGDSHSPQVWLEAALDMNRTGQCSLATHRASVKEARVPKCGPDSDWHPAGAHRRGATPPAASLPRRPQGPRVAARAPPAGSHVERFRQPRRGRARCGASCEPHARRRPRAAAGARQPGSPARGRRSHSARLSAPLRRIPVMAVAGV